jgi:hypothetical protein
MTRRFAFLMTLQLILAAAAATGGEACADSLQLSSNTAPGSPGVEARAERARMQVIGMLPETVLGTEEARLGLTATFPEIAPLSVPRAHSVLQNCPDPKAPMQVLNQMVFTATPSEPGRPVTAHVNTILGLAGCKMQSIVEMDLTFNAPGSASPFNVTRYLLLARSAP